MARVAIRRIKKINGKIRVVYVDAATGDPISSLAGYTLKDTNYSPSNENMPHYPTTDMPHGLSAAEGMPHGLDALKNFPHSGFLPDSLTDPSDEENTEEGTEEEIIPEDNWIKRNGSPDNETGREAMDRNPSNNFGYANKPAVMGLLSAVPGMPGMIGKAINAAINANNTQAVNAARGFLGLPSLGPKDTIKSIAQDQHGVVAEVDIGGQQVAIGLEASTASGRTTMTPEEAASRAQAKGVEVSEVSPEAKEAAEVAHAAEYGKQATGILGKVAETVKDVVEQATGIDLGKIKSPFKDVPSPLATPVPVTAPSVTAPSVEAPATAPSINTIGGLTGPVGAPAPSRAPSVTGGVTGQAGSGAAGQGVTGVGSGIAGNVAGQTGIGVATAGTAAASNRSIDPQAGLGNLTGQPSAKTDLSGKGRGVAPDSRLMSVIEQAVDQALGQGFTGVVSSGTYSPEQVAAINAAREEGKAKGLSGKALDKYASRKAGQIGTTRHTTGKAADFYVVGPNGSRVTDPESLGKVAEQLVGLGITGLGLDKPGGYMGGTSIHADVAQPNASTSQLGWGKVGNALESKIAENRSYGLPDAFSQGGIPTPSKNPGPNSTQVEATGMLSAEGGGRKSIAQQVTEDAVTDSLSSGLSSASPSRDRVDVTDPLARTPRSPEEIQAMALTIAGELGSKTNAAIRSGDPDAVATARQEIAAIVSTMENRAASPSYGGDMAKVLSPSQYNSLMTSNLGTTRSSYKSIGQFIEEAIMGFYTGDNPSPTPNANSYHASYMKKAPSWTSWADPTSKASVGEHTFMEITPGPGRAGFPQGLPSTVSVAGIGSRPSVAQTAVAGAIGSGLGIGSSTTGNTSVSDVSFSGGISGTSGVSGVGFGSSDFSGVGLSGSGSASSGVGSSGSGTAGVGFSGVSAGPGDGGTTGAFSDAMGSGFGDQGLAGVDSFSGGSAVGPGSAAAQQSAEASFGGTSAGSLGGTASGMGTGLGSPNAATASPGFSPGGLGNYSSPTNEGVLGTDGKVAPAPGLAPAPPGITAPSINDDMTSTFSHSMTTGYTGMGLSGLGGGSSGSSSSSSGSSQGFGGNMSAAAASAHGNEPGMGHVGASGGSGGGGDKVLCTYFFETGKLNPKLYHADQLYAAMYISDNTSKGYRLWAEPIVAYLKQNKHPILEKFLFFFVKGWATEMAYRIGVEPKSNFIGRQMCNIGEYVCGLIGKSKATRSMKRPLKENI